MCGIIGIVGHADVVPRLVSGLKSLEYRGYDSAGLAVLKQHQLCLRRSQGKISMLERLLHKDPLEGFLGIGHTRWATHGEPSEHNAHPHATDRVAVVHNGIIENHEELKESLMKEGVVFRSDTDSEVITHLITQFLTDHTPKKSVFLALSKLEGAFAIAVIFRDYDNLMIGARRGSPLVIGVGDGEMYLGSDAIAVSSLSRKLIYLEEGDCALLQRNEYTIYDESHVRVDRQSIMSSADYSSVQKGEYPHFMLKEIHEQPRMIQTLITKYITPTEHAVQLPCKMDWEGVSSLTIVACGTSYYAGLVAQYWLERYVSCPVRVEIASEFRYRKPPLPRNGMTVAISQSGETADTLAALRYAKSEGQKILSLVNVKESSVARESDDVLDLSAGPEIGVASTKAFTAQLFLLSLLAIKIGQARGRMTSGFYDDLLVDLHSLPSHVENLLKRESEIDSAAHFLKGKKSILYLGRGAQYPIALEGALKMKELAYLHAEGAPSGELKHGPIALIDDMTPVIFLLPSDDLLEKNQSNLEEIIARKGRVILFGEHDCIKRFHAKIYGGFDMPSLTTSFFLPLLYTVPVQMLAYKTAVLEGRDVDQPRNLAKSVTVE